MNVMNLSELRPYEHTAVDIVVNVINKAKEKVNGHLTLREIIHTRTFITPRVKVSCTNLKPPIGVNGRTFIMNVIEKNWSLGQTFMYVVNYVGASRDECSHYFYFEAIFSQPTNAFPIPQATVTVFFRIEDVHIKSSEFVAPMVTYRLEGHHTDHDIRYVTLTIDWLRAALQMKMKFFQRVEELRLF